MDKDYYGVRKGHLSKEVLLSFDNFKKAFIILYKKFDKDGYFQKYFGINCNDGFIEGELGDDTETIIFLKTGYNNIYPIAKNIELLNEIELFTLIEFLYDNISKPTDSWYHEWNDCGIHVTKSEDVTGRLEFRIKLNEILKRYKNVELSENGEILELIEEGFEDLFKAEIPSNDKENINNRINAAILKFRRTSATTIERMDALKNLADVLEFLKPKIQPVLMSVNSGDIDPGIPGDVDPPCLGLT